MQYQRTMVNEVKGGLREKHPAKGERDETKHMRCGGSAHDFHGVDGVRSAMERQRRLGMKGSYQRMYNPATVETVKGVVVAVEKVVPQKGMQYGIHLMVKTDKETIPVHLGPAWFIERQDMRIEKGDRIEVKGSRITINGKPAIIAAEVKKSDHVLSLRDSAGVPAWSGWRR